MDLLVLNEDFQSLGIVDVFSSLAWNRKYYQTGDYELHAPAEYFRILQCGYYLHRMDVGETAMIENIHYAMDDSGGREVSVKGRFLEQLLEGDIAVNANLVYRKDFDLGDLCVYADEDLGLEAFQRLTEISEVYENGSIQVTASFGAQNLGIMQKIKRRGK